MNSGSEKQHDHTKCEHIRGNDKDGWVYYRLATRNPSIKRCMKDAKRYAALKGFDVILGTEGFTESVFPGFTKSMKKAFSTDLVKRKCM